MSQEKLLTNMFMKAIALSTAFLCIACNINNSSNPASNSYTPYVTDLDGVFTSEDYLRIKDDKVVNAKNEEFYMRGVNVGGLFVTEAWMCATRMSHGRTDHLTLTNTLFERFGEEKTQNIWKEYRDAFWGEEDLENCEEMKINTLRLPFSYMTVDPAFHNVPKKEGQEFNFDLLDNFIEGTARYGIYVILDLHGAYGSQSGQDHTGQIISDVEDVDFYSNIEKQNKTIHLWEELAKHYKGVNSIAAYDILNEPGEKGGTTSQRHWEFFDKVYEAIRKIDEDRPIIMESCWDGNNLPKPSDYQWNNVIYSFHHYTGDSNAESHIESFKSKLNGVYAQPYQVPFYMGEFNCYGNASSWRGTLSLLNAEKWHWTSWTYKLNIVQEGNRYPGWGIYYSHQEYIWFDTDSYEEILEKVSNLDTTQDSVEKMTFENTVTLERIMRMYCEQ